MSQKFYKILTKLLLRLHSRVYSYIGRTAIKAEGGIHPKHRITNYHQFFINNVTAEDAVLDIGCGKGELAFDVSKHAKRVVAVDFSEKSIAFAREKYRAANLTYLFGDALTKTYKETFNVVILSNVLEHIENRVAFLKQVRPLADRLLIRVPAIDRDWLTLYKKELGLEWRADLTHYLEYTIPVLEAELKEAGFSMQTHSSQFGEIWAVAVRKNVA